MPFSFNLLLTIALGGAVGAVARFAVSAFCLRILPATAIPIGTLLVNAVGSFAIGWLFGLFSRQIVDDDIWRPLMITGFLGAFTTFSAFSLELIQLLQRGEVFYAAGYLFLSVGLCVSFAWLGLLLTSS